MPPTFRTVYATRRGLLTHTHAGGPGFIIGDEMVDAERCPRCQSDEVLRIAYGMPSEEMVRESIAGRVAFGGCLVWSEAPDLTCRACGYVWRSDEA